MLSDSAELVTEKHVSVTTGEMIVHRPHQTCAILGNVLACEAFAHEALRDGALLPELRRRLL